MHKLIGKMEAEDALIDEAVRGMLENEAKLKNVPYPVNEEVLRRICDMAR